MLVYVLRDVLKKKPGDDEEEDNEDDGDIGLPYFLGSLSQYLQVFLHPRWLAGFLNHQR